MTTTDKAHDRPSAIEHVSTELDHYGPDRFVAVTILLGLVGLMAMMCLEPLFAMWR